MSWHDKPSGACHDMTKRLEHVMLSASEASEVAILTSRYLRCFARAQHDRLTRVSRSMNRCFVPAQHDMFRMVFYAMTYEGTSSIARCAKTRRFFTEKQKKLYRYKV